MGKWKEDGNIEGLNAALPQESPRASLDGNEVREKNSPHEPGQWPPEMELEKGAW